ncbi:hypothetical protein [Kitasatospora cheerisanensis]|uniref:hypothetical protein n=1 Tax=Kitasatospora cheerisanensis TaxID=81942 RepID=UPI00056C342D|nr:hypothetical protein [Kitasatospora cheerisanensis]
MRTAGRAVGTTVLGALLWAAVFFAVRGLAGFSYRHSLQIAMPATVIAALFILFAGWSASRQDPTGWMIVLAVLGVAMLIAHTHLLDVRALRDHGTEQHARITEVTTHFNADNTSYPRYTLEALDGPPINGTVDGGLTDSHRIGDTVTVITDPTGHVPPDLGTLPSATAQLWTTRADDAIAALMIFPAAGWALDRIRKPRKRTRR